MVSGDHSSESEEPSEGNPREKVAVLFGNDNYDEPLTKLTCCRSDVRALSPKFEEAGFTCVPACNVSSQMFRESIEDARNYIGWQTNVVVFHWSGHGQYDDRTRLITTDGEPIDLHGALTKLLKKTRRSAIVIVILDCCRNFPVNADSGSGACEASMESEKLKENLWQEKCEEMYVKAPQGHGPKDRNYIFFFATGLGERAQEVNKDGKHGALTRAVLQHLFKEGELSDIIEAISLQVQRDTKQWQRSWISSNAVGLIGNPVVLKPCCFEVLSEAGRKIRQGHQALDKQKRRVEKLERESREMTGNVHKGADDDEAFPPKLQNHPAALSPSSVQPIRRQSDCSTIDSCSSRKVWIAIDGPIGVGKTKVLMNEFTREISPNVERLREPVDEWLEGPLTKIYDSASSPSDIFEAQMKIWLHFEEMATKFDLLTDKTFITERSPISVVKIFCQNFLDEGRITQEHFEIFRHFLQLLQERNSLPTHYVLLEASVETCQERIKGRGRKEEQAIPNAYLENIQTLLDKVYEQVEEQGGTVIRINAEEAEEVVKEAFLEKIRALRKI